MKNLIKRALIGVLAGVMLVTSPAVARASEVSETSEKGAKLRQQVQEAIDNPRKLLNELGYPSGAFKDAGVLKSTDYEGADFEYHKKNSYLSSDVVYFKIEDDSTIRMIGSDNSSGAIMIDGIKGFYGLDFDKIIVDSFEGNKKLTRFSCACDVPIFLSKNCFKDCTNLRSFTVFGLTHGLANIPDGAFKNCKKLSDNITIDANKVDKIGKSAFENCTNLDSFKIRNAHKFKSIGDSAFKNCKGLSYVYFNSDKFRNRKAVLKYYKTHKKIKFGKKAFRGTSTDCKEAWFIVGNNSPLSDYYGGSTNCSGFATGDLPGHFLVGYVDK